MGKLKTTDYLISPDETFHSRSRAAVFGFATEAVVVTPAFPTGIPHPRERATSDHWFEVYKIRPGVFAIYEPHAHNAEPGYLPRVVEAMEQVRGGKVKGTLNKCKQKYIWWLFLPDGQVDRRDRQIPGSRLFHRL